MRKVASKRRGWALFCKQFLYTEFQGIYERCVFYYENMEIRDGPLRSPWTRSPQTLRKLGFERPWSASTFGGPRGVEFGGSKLVHFGRLEKYAHPASQEASRLEKYAHPASQEASRLEKYAHPASQDASRLETYAHPASQEASRLEEYAHPASQDASRLEQYAHPASQEASRLR